MSENICSWLGSAPAIELTQSINLLALILFEFEHQPLQALASAELEQRAQDGHTYPHSI